MTWPSFLLRLVGKAPEQVEVQENFKKALSKMDEVDSELDELLEEIRSVDSTVKAKSVALGITASSTPPGTVRILNELKEQEKEESDERRPHPSLGKPAPTEA